MHCGQRQFMHFRTCTAATPGLTYGVARWLIPRCNNPASVMTINGLRPLTFFAWNILVRGGYSSQRR